MDETDDPQTINTVSSPLILTSMKFWRYPATWGAESRRKGNSSMTTTVLDS